jgi:hypothetical protein
MRAWKSAKRFMRYTSVAAGRRPRFLGAAAISVDKGNAGYA